MTLDDLKQCLRQTVSGGQVGTPVALRLNLQLSEGTTDILARMAAVVVAANEIFAGVPKRLMVQGGIGCQMTVLASYETGETLFVTVGAGVARQSSVRLLLIGNHGVANLDGLELDQPVAESVNPEEQHWRELLQKSLQTRKPIAMEN